VRSTDFHLVTDWTLAAPCHAVWNELVKPENWPAWWRAVERVELLEPGDADGVGALRRMTWRTALPYSLTFDMRTMRVQPMTLIEGHAEGELTGVGRWTIADDGAQTRVRYDWRVEVTQPWMRFVAPLARPVFAWNHGVVMGWGREGISRRLTAPA
jgi:Polyketide cyclase / dehydrase and lipid transport